MQIASTKTKESDPFAKEEVAEEECSHVRHGGEKTRGQKSPKEIRFQKAIQDIIEKLLHDSTHITKEDAQRLQNNPDRDIADHRAESIITAVEILASANERVHAGNSSNDAQIGLPSTTTQSTGTQKDSPVHAAPQPHAGLKTLREIATKVHAEIDANPTSVTTEDLRLFQNVVGKIQKTLGAVPAAVPHPDLEEEFQKEIAKIEPKVEQGTVTKEEADRLHSLESRAHGHTEKGGVTAQAQSVAAKRSRGLSISASHNTTTSNISVAVSRAHSAGQPHQGKETNLGNAAAGIQPKIGSAHETVANEDGNLQAQGATRKGRITTEAASLVDNNEGVSSA
ncbi:hypothetical protein K432DRAFT_381733 [Lepidopterella palustris CBS 459.81]|uniref:SMP domain-containing protein n=1 Tax=Lepidopterella palustris CBS 459.81 TaxID=1314670 RepID=A0A8E2JGD4_9PEZI|nr:hypothetical protein K432DRAFT_381733 [Lepidopterella palustris CBS 459.81]